MPSSAPELNTDSGSAMAARLPRPDGSVATHDAHEKESTSTPVPLGVRRAREGVGNAWMAGALLEGEVDGLQSIVAAEMALASEAVQIESTFESNEAMQRAMRHVADSKFDPQSYAHVMGLIEASHGGPIPDAVASRLSSVLGHDISHARIHVDSAAAQAAEALGAKAFALGADVYFGPGTWAPGTRQGDALLAHELTHVKQYDEGRLQPTTGQGLDVSSPSDPTEQEAEAVEASVAPDLAEYDEAHESADAGSIEADAQGNAADSPLMQAPEATATPNPTPAANDGGGAEPAAGGDGASPQQATNNGAKIEVENTYDVGGDKKRTTVGVLEETFFQINEVGVVWSSTGGTGTANANSYTWKAPDATATVTIKATLPDKTEQTVSMSVVEPATVTGKSSTDMSFGAGTEGAGMNLELEIGPTTVSFSNITWKEVAGPTSGITGYFTDHTPKTHAPAAASKPSSGNIIKDKASMSGYPKPWKAGVYEWVIPNHWAPPGGAGKLIQDVTQHMEITDDKGTSTVTKAGKTAGPRTP